MNKKIEIYSDAACRGNPGPGRWGAVLMYGDKTKEIFGGEDNTTNNCMELMAAIESLTSLKRSCELTLYTDSQYVRKGITERIVNWERRNWKTAAKKTVKNAGLRRQLDEQVARHSVEWVWVKGHDGNELADQLANKGGILYE